MIAERSLSETYEVFLNEIVRIKTKITVSTRSSLRSLVIEADEKLNLSKIKES
jgi:hypothetical protein